MNNQQIILNFLKAYKEWVEAGVPKHECFATNHGLCANLDQYALYKHRVTGSRLVSLGDSMCSLFEEDNLSVILPFNMPSLGQPHYFHEVHHENPWRIKWVNDTITKLEGKTKMNPNAVPLGTKVVLVVLAVAAIIGVFAVTGPIGGLLFFAFMTFSVLNKAPRKNINSRGDQGDF